MAEIQYKREPIIFPDVDSVQQILEDKIPAVAEENCFKLCNFCGPYRTHADGCETAIQMFEKCHPEFQKMNGFNNWLNGFRFGAGFMNRGTKSVVVFVSTITEKETNGSFKKWHEVFTTYFNE